MKIRLLWCTTDLLRHDDLLHLRYRTPRCKSFLSFPPQSDAMQNVRIYKSPTATRCLRTWSYDIFAKSSSCTVELSAAVLKTFFSTLPSMIFSHELLRCVLVGMCRWVFLPQSLVHHPAWSTSGYFSPLGVSPTACPSSPTSNTPPVTQQ